MDAGKERGRWGCACGLFRSRRTGRGGVLGEGFRKRAGVSVGDVGRVYAGIADAVVVGAGECKSAYTYVSADVVAEV